VQSSEALGLAWLGTEAGAAPKRGNAPLCLGDLRFGRGVPSWPTPMLVSPAHPLCLGSASPRRSELLGGLGLPLRIVPAHIEEEPFAGEAPLSYLERIVGDKLRAVALLGEPLLDCAAILVADTIVVIDEQIINKPKDVADAERLLSSLCGREHVVFTRYALSLEPRWDTSTVARTIRSTVTLRSAPEEVLRRYAATGEGLDKAGAYAVQGIGAFLVERIDGSYSNVVGLPVCEVVRDLFEQGLLEDFPFTASP
jgi:septum formation protein